MNKSANNFLNLPSKYSNLKNCRFVIIPVPFEKTVTWKKGTAHGPEAIIEASAQCELYDIETDSEAYKYGIYTHQEELDIASSEVMIKSVKKTVQNYLEQNKFSLVIGGEHSVSIGAIKAVAEKNQDMTVLQLDAHTDLRDTYEGSEFNHACVMARVKEICPIVQVGIRSMDFSEKKAIDPDRIFYAREIRDTTAWINSVLNLLHGNIYITLDLDVFDPSIMPSTGTPEPGGLQWYEVINFIKKVFMTKNVVGCDVVELCPQGNHGADFLAAKLIYKMINYYVYFNKSCIPHNEYMEASL